MATKVNTESGFWTKSRFAGVAVVMTVWLASPM